MPYIPSPTPRHVPCGTGSLTISVPPSMQVSGPPQVIAKQIARLPGAYVTTQVTAASQRRLGDDAALGRQVALMRRPEFDYTVGEPTPLPFDAWYFPLEVFVIERGA